MKRTSIHRSTQPRLTRSLRIHSDREDRSSFLRQVDNFSKALNHLIHRQPPEGFKYSKNALETMHSQRLGNRRFEASANDCGCFRCLSHFSVEDIEWCLSEALGDTAICPRCKIDSVIIETELNQVDDVLLSEMQAWYFESAIEDSGDPDQ